MSVRYKLVLRKDLSKDAAEGAQKYYASVNSNGMMTFQQTCTAISAYSTASPGDVKVVMDGLLFVLKEALLRGEVVQLGELGNFQINVGSSGTPTTEEFKASMIRKPRIVFRPSVSLKEILDKVSFERINAGTSGKDDSGSSDRPEIE
ncbi:HU family DNA-binding protein [Parabacteroides goldsteinii]|jgi:predicted histone-like DNA-binding protein|uniref:HU family DNA-binding protein n=1 Tax=Parabacteroides goldsteinii TaxID=328812 RepID=UPI001CC9679A|nr:HU family DNA-binding protein [Parabacteroides goldsteinii]UBD77414.1 HU family DNA-binding protein [Parabacteroides goldsteinii]